MANQFLDYFFDDEQVDANNESIKNMRLLIKEKTRFIQQPSSEVASQANGLLKSEALSSVEGETIEQSS
jgi:hypothetical protein